MAFDNKVAGQSPTLTSLLISFTRSISHLSLPVLVTYCQFYCSCLSTAFEQGGVCSWRLLRLTVPIMVVTKTLASVTTGLLIMLPFRHALLTACGTVFFQTIFEKSASFFKSKTTSAPINTSIKSLTHEVLRAYKTVLLGKRIKIRIPNYIRFPNSGGS